MGKLDERENRRRASVVGSIAGVEPEIPGAKKGRPKEIRETKKRVSLSVLPSLYEDIQKIAYVQRRSVSEIVAEQLGKFRDQHTEAVAEYERLKRSGGSE